MILDLFMVIISFRISYMGLLMVTISFRISYMDLSMVIISFERGNTGNQAMLIQFWTEKYWSSSEHGNTANQFILIQFWTWKYWNSSHSDSALIQEGRAAGRPGGRVGWPKSIGKESILGICILKDLDFVYIIEYWLFECFSKKMRAKKIMKFGPILAARSLIWDRFRPEN